MKQTQGQLSPIENAYTRLLGEMDSQVRLLLELESLGQKQRAAIECDEPETILEMLDERQRLIDSLTGLDREIASLRAIVESQGTRIVPSQREEISRRATTVSHTIRRVLVADAADAEVIERRRAQIAGELSGVSDSRRAAAAYHPGAGRTSGDSGAMFQDRSA